MWTDGLGQTDISRDHTSLTLEQSHWRSPILGLRDEMTGSWRVH